jgi:hypothetical protein
VVSEIGPEEQEESFFGEPTAEELEDKNELLSLLADLESRAQSIPSERQTLQLHSEEGQFEWEEEMSEPTLNLSVF